MRIKNKHELVLRARAHAKHDRIKQGTYGEVDIDGNSPIYQGCAIGCLSTPHRKRSLIKYIKDTISNTDNKYLEEFMPDHRDLMKDLEREFGINNVLIRLVESIFEGLPTHGDAIEFIPAFAEALPEGADIKPKDVRRFISNAAERYPELELNEYAEPTYHYSIGQDSKVLSLRDDFLCWLGKQGVKQRESRLSPKLAKV